MIHSRNPLSRLLLPLVLAVAGAALCAVLIPAEQAAVSRQLVGFPDSDVFTQEMRPLILGALCFLPALGSLIYAFGGTMDRYIAREFAGIFGVCISALVLIWLIMDLNDKVSDFRNTGNAFPTMLKFYGTRAPAVLLLLMPYSLLLSLLYSLGKLSSNLTSFGNSSTGSQNTHFSALASPMPQATILQTCPSARSTSLTPPLGRRDSYFGTEAPVVAVLAVQTPVSPLI